MERYRKPLIIEPKTNDLAQAKATNKLYKNADADVAGKISALVGEKMLLLAEIEKRGKTNLKNLDEVRAVTYGYLEACRRSDTVPSFEGLCLSLGYSRQWLYAFISSRKSGDLVAEYLDRFRTLVAEIVTSASMRRYIDCATAIFSLKNMCGLGFSDKGDTLPEAPSAVDENQESAAFWRQKYGNLSEIEE